MSAFPPATLFSCENTSASDDVPDTDTYSRGKYQKPVFWQSPFFSRRRYISARVHGFSKCLGTEFKRDGIAPWEARM
jgi:hypothetical protein